MPEVRLGPAEALRTGEVVVSKYEGESGMAEIGLGDCSCGGDDKGPRWGKEERRKGEMQEAVGKEESGGADWQSWMEEGGHVGEEEVGSGEGMEVEGEGREFEGGVQGEVGSFSLEVGRSSLARINSCQGRPEMASCYMPWLCLECRE